ncbi:hypothetical protein A9Q84_15740 [Halobacteriovorax marinus]|uniref:FAD dependent oxidoreductase domain-containing protein n=1 Tax=Halobacteriovorax marinus TaxID=97084 RepID=A0A1Y5F7W7_9BACT|nr:hypothetical protein A9Q84_15740 [Halobacteriovorax marinus]
MTHDIADFDILILGNGICGQSILFEMINSPSFDLDTLKVGQVFCEHMAPACTLNTTSVVGLNGTSRGINDLGDLIIDSFHFTKKLVEKLGLKSFYPGTHYFLQSADEKNKAKFIRRHGEGSSLEILDREFIGVKDENFVVDSEELFCELEEVISSNNIVRINEAIVNVSDEREVTLLDGRVIRAKKIICCLGAYSNHFLKNISNEHLDFSKMVPGDFLKFRDVNLGDKSFVVSSGQHNLVYRANSHTVLIGGTTLNNLWDSVDYVKIIDQYNYYKNLFGDLLPDFSEAFLGSGLRHKGRRRRPFCGELREGIYSLHGVYKNGYTFSFFLANKLLQNEIKGSI